MTSVALLSTLQQVQANLAALFPSRGAASTTSDAATLASFQQMLASLSAAPASGILGTLPAGQILGTLPTSTAATTSAPPAPSGGVTGAQVVADAQQYLGVPYVLGGTGSSGIDCSGLVQKVYGDVGIKMPRLVHSQAVMGTAVPSLAQAQPGDLIVFKGGGHIAIYEGNGRVMHAPHPGRVVSDVKLWVGDSGIETIRRIVPSAGTTDAAPGSSAAAASASTSAATGTSAAVQAAALATVRAIIQADSGLLASATSASSVSSGSGSSSLQSAISAMAGGTNDGTSATGLPTTSATAASSAAQQSLTSVQSMLMQALA